MRQEGVNGWTVFGVWVPSKDCRSWVKTYRRRPDRDETPEQLQLRLERQKFYQKYHRLYGARQFWPVKASMEYRKQLDLINIR